LGSNDFQKQNWEGILEKVCSKLSEWKWLLPQLSYRGRILVTNILVASTLWHTITVLQPSAGLIEEIQRKLVTFFLVWSTLDSCCCFISSCSRGGSRRSRSDPELWLSGYKQLRDYCITRLYHG